MNNKTKKIELMMREERVVGCIPKYFRNIQIVSHSTLQISSC